MRRDIFQAIADPTRRAIITLIALQAMTPNAIADEFHSSRQAVSKHIQVLTECDLVKQEQKGREIYYHINANKMKEIDKWIEQFKRFGNSVQSIRQSITTLKIKMKMTLFFDFTVDRSEYPQHQTRIAPTAQPFGIAILNLRSLISGGCQNRGNHAQKAWTSVKVVNGTMQPLDQMEKNIGRSPPM